MTSAKLDARLRKDIGKLDSTVVALGSFDGMHIGHRAIIDAAVRLASELKATPAVFTFDTIPACHLSATPPSILSNTDERCELLYDAGIAGIFIASFPDLMGMSPEDFINDILIKQCHAEGVVCGFNFKFGKNGSGNIRHLENVFGKNAHCIPAVTVDDAPVSSSRIRNLVTEGNVEDASTLLGRPYSITLPVVHGRHDGTGLGFPTLNQIPESNRVIPAPGVYVTSSRLPDGRRIPSVTNVGSAPTLDPNGSIHFETHLLDSSEDLYDKTVTVEFRRRLRPETTFPDPNSLTRQISSDVEQARLYFSSNHTLNTL